MKSTGGLTVVVTHPLAVLGGTASPVVTQVCVLLPALPVVADQEKALALPGLIIAPVLTVVQVITLPTTPAVQFVGGVPAATTVKLASTVSCTLLMRFVLKPPLVTVSVKAVLVVGVAESGELVVVAV